MCSFLTCFYMHMQTLWSSTLARGVSLWESEPVHLVPEAVSFHHSSVVSVCKEVVCLE